MPSFARDHIATIEEGTVPSATNEQYRKSLNDEPSIVVVLIQKVYIASIM